MSWIEAATAATEKKEGKIVFGTPKDGQQWGKKVISLFFAYGVEIWKHRNFRVHGETKVE